MGTKSHLDYVSPAADSISKPLETAGRKAMGAKVLKVLRQPGRRTLCIRVLAKKGLGRNMSKKKNVKSKKAKTLLRGAVAAGVAIGGADVLGDSNVVYAAEGEFEQFSEGTNEIVVPSYSEQTLSEGAAEALQEQPAVEENAAAVPVETIEQPTEQPAVNVETPENEQVNTVMETDSVPAEPAGDVNAVNPEEKADETQTPENENQEDVTNPEQESSEISMESTESASGEGFESEAESTESTESENSESEAESMESAVSENSESEEVSDEESLASSESLSISIAESMSASVLDSLKSEAKSNEELKNFLDASESASTSLASMNNSLSAESLRVSTALSQEESTAVSQSASAELSSQQASTNWSTSLSVATSEQESMSTSVSAVHSEYQDKKDKFEESGHYDQEFEALLKEVKQQQEALQEYVNKGGEIGSKEYWNLVDKLAWGLTKYAFKVQTFGDGVKITNPDADPEQKKGYSSKHPFIAGGETDRDNYYVA